MIRRIFGRVNRGVFCCSGISVGSRVEIEPSDVGQNDCSESLLVAKAARGLPESLDLRVDAFRGSVGAPMRGEGYDAVGMGFEGVGRFPDFCHRR
jgi:hypothetical protein